MTRYEKFSYFVVSLGAIFGIAIGVPVGLAIDPKALFLIILGTLIGTTIGINVGLTMLRTDLVKRSLQRAKIFGIWDIN